MRYEESGEDASAKYAMTGTNPEGSITLSKTLVPLYLAQHCKTVDEALALLPEINITAGIAQPYGCLMADATGHCGLLEIAGNTYYWTDMQQLNTNFFIAEEPAAIEEYPLGFGRYELMEKETGGVESVKDMMEMMKRVAFFSFYTPNTCAFAITSDLVDVSKGWSYAYVTDEKNKAEMDEYIAFEEERAAAMSPEDIRNDGDIFATMYREAVDLTSREIYITFFDFDGNEDILQLKISESG